MSQGRPREGTMGALAPSLWNLQNVDFSGVARFFGLEGHKGAKVFHVGGHGRPHEEGNGALALALALELKKYRFQWRNQDFWTTGA